MNKFFAFVLAMPAIAASAHGSSHPKDDHSTEMQNGKPCMIRINDSTWVNAKAVTALNIEEWKGDYSVHWWTGSRYVSTRALNYKDAGNWITWFIGETERTCK